MTVAEMIAKLSEVDPSLPVYFLAESDGVGSDLRKPSGSVAVVCFRGGDEHECLLLSPGGKASPPCPASPPLATA